MTHLFNHFIKVCYIFIWNLLHIVCVYYLFRWSLDRVLQMIYKCVVQLMENFSPSSVVLPSSLFQHLKKDVNNFYLTNG